MLALIIRYGAVDFYKINAVKAFVEVYLEEEGHTDNKIRVLEKFRTNLPGDRHWMVAVTLKDDPKTYYYFKTKNKLVLEFYVLKKTENVVNKVVKTRHSQ